MAKCYKLTRGVEGEDLGTFKTQDEAKRTADEAARQDGYRLDWKVVQSFGAIHGIPVPKRHGSQRFSITVVDCD